MLVRVKSIWRQLLFDVVVLAVCLCLASLGAISVHAALAVTAVSFVSSVVAFFENGTGGSRQAGDSQ